MDIIPYYKVPYEIRKEQTPTCLFIKSLPLSLFVFHAHTHIRSHLYYVEDNVTIYRMNLDGTDNVLVYNALVESLLNRGGPIVGLAVDPQNRLFWTFENRTEIQYINITEWEEGRNVEVRWVIRVTCFE